MLAPVLHGASQAASSATPMIGGKWMGNLDIVHPDGSVDPDVAYLMLTQNGDQITGKAGNRLDQLSPVTGGTISGGTVQFTVTVNPQKIVQFDLKLDGDRMSGTASGLPVETGSKIVVNVIRADGGWHTTDPPAHAQDGLIETITALDKKLFDAYNTCDLKTMGALVSDDLEFYHDKTGMAVGRQIFLDSIRDNICGKVQRVIVPGTLEVHRLQGFGAMEIVTHRFTHPGDPDNVGEAKSIMLWRNQNGNWQMTRVISYDHGPASK